MEFYICEASIMCGDCVKAKYPRAIDESGIMDKIGEEIAALPEQEMTDCPLDPDRVPAECHECNKGTAHAFNDFGGCYSCNDLSREERLDTMEAIGWGPRERAEHLIEHGADLHL